jgi:hypothetical protein
MPALETLRNEPDIVHAVVIEAVIASVAFGATGIHRRRDAFMPMSTPAFAKAVRGIRNTLEVGIGNSELNASLDISPRDIL